MDDLISRQAAIDAFNVCVTIGRKNGKTVAFEDVNDYANAVIKRITTLPSVKEKPFNLPEIHIADGYDTIEGEDGNVGFGVYVPDEKQIYIAGDVDNEVRLKALFHELCHWVQDMCGRPFDEDEANRFAEAVYDAVPSAQPEQTEMAKEIRKWINSGNRGSADYFIVDKIEEIINKYE